MWSILGSFRDLQHADVSTYGKRAWLVGMLRSTASLTRVRHHVELFDPLAIEFAPPLSIMGA
jgi:hypothetical protein